MVNAAFVEPEAGVAGEVAGGGCYAAVAGGVFHPGGGYQGIALAIRAVVVEGDAAGGHAAAGGVGDDGVGVVHPQGGQDAAAQDGGVVLAGDILQQPAEDFVAGVGVMEAGAGRPGGLGMAQGVGFVAGGRGEVGAGGQAGGVAQQVAQGDGGVGGRDGQPGQVSGYGGVQVQAAGCHQLHYRQGGH